MGNQSAGNGCERHGRTERQERQTTAASAQYVLKRRQPALLFPYTDPPKFWLWGAAKNYPFAIEDPIHD
jgi:hypothetical protein